MGDEADWQLERNMYREMYPRGFDEVIFEPVDPERIKWTAADGIRTTLKDVTTRHLGNIANVLEGRGSDVAKSVRKYYEKRVREENELL